MKVHDLILVGSSSVPDTESGENAPAPQKEELSLAVGDFASAMSNDNITMAALKEYFKDNNGRTAVSMTSFSSEFKYSSVTFSDVSYVLGAPEFVLRDDFARYQSEIEAYTSKGFRLLVFGTSETVRMESTLQPCHAAWLRASLQSDPKRSTGNVPLL